jgi:hypothetical protein
VDHFFVITDGKVVKFIFVCPNKNKVLERLDFKILSNRGTITDEAGNKSLDAKVDAKANCWTRYYANPNPATQVFEWMDKIPQALSKLLANEPKEEIHG